MLIHYLSRTDKFLIKGLLKDLDSLDYQYQWLSQLHVVTFYKI